MDERSDEVAGLGADGALLPCDFLAPAAVFSPFAFGLPLFLVSFCLTFFLGFLSVGLSDAFNFGLGILAELVPGFLDFLVRLMINTLKYYNVYILRQYGTKCLLKFSLWQEKSDGKTIAYGEYVAMLIQQIVPILKLVSYLLAQSLFNLTISGLFLLASVRISCSRSS